VEAVDEFWGDLVKKGLVVKPGAVDEAVSLENLAKQFDDEDGFYATTEAVYAALDVLQSMFAEEAENNETIAAKADKADEEDDLKPGEAQQGLLVKRGKTEDVNPQGTPCSMKSTEPDEDVVSYACTDDATPSASPSIVAATGTASKEEQAAIKLQAAARGASLRRGLSSTKASEEEQAAIKVQAAASRSTKALEAETALVPASKDAGSFQKPQQESPEPVPVPDPPVAEEAKVEPQKLEELKGAKPHKKKKSAAKSNLADFEDDDSMANQKKTLSKKSSKLKDKQDKPDQVEAQWEEVNGALKNLRKSLKLVTGDQQQQQQQLIAGAAATKNLE
jgi:hypothetical protein